MTRKTEREHIFYILDFLQYECRSAGGDGDATWLATFYTLETILPYVMEWNAQWQFPWKVEVKNDQQVISLDYEQENILITTNKDVYDNLEEWTQMVLKL